MPDIISLLPLEAVSVNHARVVPASMAMQIRTAATLIIHFFCVDFDFVLFIFQTSLFLFSRFLIFRVISGLGYGDDDLKIADIFTHVRADVIG